MSMTEFLAMSDPPPADTQRPVFRARRSLTASGDSIRISTPNYDYEYLCADLRQKRMVPIISRIKAHDIVEFGGPAGHQGRELIYWPGGAIEVHLQFYTPVPVTADRGSIWTA